MYIGLHAKYRYSCQILMKRVLRQIFGKYSSIIFYENLFIVSRVFSCGRRMDRQTEYRQMDRHVEANSRFLQFSERA